MFKKLMPSLFVSCLLAFMYVTIGTVAPVFTPHQTAFANPPAPQVIGPGCTTAFFIDDDCDGCGVGVRSSGIYGMTPSPGVISNRPANYGLSSIPGMAFPSMGDTPDADDGDATVCTTAQWQTKWLAQAPFSTDGQCVVSWASCTGKQQNQAFINFINVRKNIQNTTRIWYLDPSGANGGNDATAVVNNPKLPFLSMACVEGGNSYSSNPSPPQLPVTCTNPNGNPTPQDQLGGIIVVFGGTYGNGASGLYLSACSSPLGKTNPCWELSGSPGHPLMLLGYPGQIIANETAPMINVTGVFAPLHNNCCVVLDGVQFIDGVAAANGETYGNGQGVTLSYVSNWTIQNSEFTGGDKATYFGTTVNTTVQSSVIHDTNNHAVYYGPTGLGYVQTPAYGDFNFALDQAIVTQHNRQKFTGTATMTSGSKTIVVNTVSFGNLYPNDPIEGVGIPPGLPLAGSDSQITAQTIGSDGSTCPAASCNGTTGTYTMTQASNCSATCGTPIAVKVQDAFASYYPKVLNDVIYSVGNSGFEPIHFNSMLYGGVVSGNICSFSAGPCFTAETSLYHSLISDNLFFDFGRACIGIYHGAEGTIQYSHRWDTIQNNICWQGNSVGGAWNGTATMSVTAVNGVYTTNSFNVSVSSSGGLQPGDQLSGPGLNGGNWLVNVQPAAGQVSTSTGTYTTTGVYTLQLNQFVSPSVAAAVYFVSGTTAAGCAANQSFCAKGYVQDAILNIMAVVGGTLSAGQTLVSNGGANLPPNTTVGSLGTFNGTSCATPPCTVNLSFTVSGSGAYSTSIRGTSPASNGIDQLVNPYPLVLNTTGVTYPVTGVYNKNMTIKNNILVEDASVNNINPTGTPVPFGFGAATYPETDIISGNTVFNVNAAGNCCVLTIAANASPVSVTGLYNFAGFQGYSPYFAGNKYTDPLFAAANISLQRAPGTFNFNTCAQARLVPDPSEPAGVRAVMFYDMLAVGCQHWIPPITVH